VAVPPLLWDQHCCLPLVPDADVRELLRFREIGAGFVSVNAGYAPNDADSTLALLAAFRRQIFADERFVLAASAADVVTAHASGRLAVAFDLEDANPLDGRLALVERYHRLGIRTLVPTYNYRNAAGSGCMDADDGGLTAYGRTLVREMNRVGMVADGSHSSIRTGLDLCAVSTRPVIYSHTCMRSVWEHERNITDEQARACAATGGVIGITGVGIFGRPLRPRIPGGGGRRHPRRQLHAGRPPGMDAGRAVLTLLALALRGSRLDIDAGVKG